MVCRELDCYPHTVRTHEITPHGTPHLLGAPPVRVGIGL